ncbi:MAG: hypothetical protein K2J71_02070, partial [Oscillospiraceae bacterium]|nr:hypothetical protein [Oscillospiraceae bacterium]
YPMCNAMTFCNVPFISPLDLLFPIGELQQVDLKVSPKGEGFNPIIQTIKQYTVDPAVYC